MLSPTTISAAEWDSIINRWTQCGFCRQYPYRGKRGDGNFERLLGLAEHGKVWAQVIIAEGYDVGLLTEKTSKRPSSGIVVLPFRTPTSSMLGTAPPSLLKVWQEFMLWVTAT